MIPPRGIERNPSAAAVVPESAGAVAHDDHAWCVACDVDPHRAGIGAEPEAVDHLLAESRLDVVRADPERQQPFYR